MNGDTSPAFQGTHNDECDCCECYWENCDPRNPAAAVPSLVDQGDPTAVALHRTLTAGLAVWNTRDGKGLTPEEIDERVNNLIQALTLEFELNHIGE